jgi:hypothetical protein
MSICRMWRVGFPLLLMSAICSMASADAWVPRCAVIVEGPSAASATSIASLVEAELSGKNVQLVDRQSINRLLQEQYLSKTGLIDADHAVSAGKILSADLLAFVSVSADSSTIIVFDANSGVRLDDATTGASGEALAGEVSRHILQAVDKDARGRNRGAGTRIKTVCLQTVRNADLPLEKESVARAAGEILMRRLAGSPDAAVLERERLSHVTQERQLTGVENTLIASTVSIELQIARDPDRSGIIVSAVLDYGSHERKASAGVHVPTENPDDIAVAILPQIVQMLQVTPPAVPTEAERVAESKRFVREVMLLWSHDEAGAALDAAEAAYALDPADFDAGAVRARAIVVLGLEQVCYGQFINPVLVPQPYLQDHPQKLTASLRLVDRACDALEVLEFGATAAGPTTAPAFPAMTPLDRDSLAVNAQMLVRRYLYALRSQMPERGPSWTGISPFISGDEQTALLKDIRQRFYHRRFELERAYARQLVSDRHSLSLYEGFLEDLFHDSRCAWFVDGKQWTQEWAILIGDWIALEKQYGPPSVPAFPRRGAHRRPTTGGALAPSATTEPSGTPQTRSAIPATEPAKVTLQPGSEAPIPEAVAQIGLMYAYYHFRTTPPDYNWRMTPDDWQRLVDATAAFRDLPGVQAQRLADAMRDYARPYIHPQSTGAISSRPGGAPPPPVRHLIAPQQLQGQALEEPKVGAGTDWPDSIRLTDTDTQDAHGVVREKTAIEFPLVDRATNTAYGLSFVTPRDRGERPRIDLIRFRLTDGSSARVCSYIEPVYADRPHGWKIDRLALDSSALTEGYYLYCNADAGVFLFPTSGGPVITVDRLTAGLPARSFQAAALLEGTVYLAIGQVGHEGYLLSLNLKDRILRTLASSRRVSATSQAGAGGNAASAILSASPFDDAPPLIAWYMQADPARHRIVMLVSNPAWPRGLSGWWDFSPASGQFKLLAPIDMTHDTDRMSVGDWQSPCRKDCVAFSTRMNPAAVLDLAKDRIVPMPPVPGAPHYSGPINVPAGGRALGYPMIPANDWIWGRFGRYRVVHTTGQKDSIELQSYQPLTPENTQWGLWPRYLEPVDDDHVIIGDKGKLWLLHVPSDPAALSRLLQPPRPMYVVVEPTAGPPSDARLPWTSVTAICDAASGKNVGDDSPDFLLAPQILGNDVYVFASGNARRRGSGLLEKFSLLDGKRTDLGNAFASTLDPRFGRLAERATIHISGCNSCIDEHNYYLVVPNSQVLAFPLAGGAPRQFTFDGIVSQIAAVSETLFVIERVLHPRTAAEDFASWTEQLVRINVATGARQTLPLLKAEPDSGLLPAVNVMRADGRRGRVLFFVHRSRRADSTVSGLWSCALAGAPVRADPFDIWAATGERFGGVGDWAGEIGGDEWLLLSNNGAVRLNLATMKAERLWQVEPVGACPLAAQYDFRPPFAVVDGWLWDGMLRRAKLDGSRFEQLPYPRPMDSPQHQMSLSTMLCIHDGKDLLLADNCGMWIAKMRDR